MSLRKAKGFTIFELMITVAIAAVVTAFAIPAFQDLMARNRVNSTAEEMLNALSMARNTAITTRRPVFVKKNGEVWEFRQDSSAGPLISTVTSTSPVAVLAWQGADEGKAVTEIRLQPSGLAHKMNDAEEPLDLSLRICDDDSTREVGRTITMNRIGRARSAMHADASTCNP